MEPRRINRLAIHARLPDVETWIIEGLLDAFEPAALKAAAATEKKRPKGAAPDAPATRGKA